MSVRGLVMPNRASAIGIQNRVRNAHGLPICGRLTPIGNRWKASNTDGSPLRVCGCTVATNPVASCPYATRAMDDVLDLVAGGAIAVIDEADATTVGTLTGPERAAIATVTDAQIARPGAGAGALVAGQEDR